jgi:hypothetical protein
MERKIADAMRQLPGDRIGNAIAAFSFRRGLTSYSIAWAVKTPS